MPHDELYCRHSSRMGLTLATEIMAPGTLL